MASEELKKIPPQVVDGDFAYSFAHSQVPRLKVYEILRGFKIPVFVTSGEPPRTLENFMMFSLAAQIINLLK